MNLRGTEFINQCAKKHQSIAYIRCQIEILFRPRQCLTSEKQYGWYLNDLMKHVKKRAMIGLNLTISFWRHRVRDPWVAGVKGLSIRRPLGQYSSANTQEISQNSGSISFTTYCKVNFLCDELIFGVNRKEKSWLSELLLQKGWKILLLWNVLSNSA